MAIVIPLKSVFDNSGIDSATKSLKGFAKIALATVSVAAVGNFLSDSAKAATEDAKSQALLARQLKATTGATSGQISQVNKAISSMESMSSVADDSIRPAFAQLTRATGDVGKATDLTRLALDVSAGTGKNVESVAIALGKAYQGNTAGLAKLGINVKGMKDPMSALQKQFAGAAQTAANNDPYQQMTLAMDNIHEAVGTALLPVLQQFAQWLVSVVPQIQSFFTQLTDPTTQVGEVWKVLSDVLSTVFNFIKDNIAPIGAFVGVLLAVKGAVELWSIAQAVLNAIMAVNPITLIVIAIAALVAGIVWLATKTTFFQDVWKGLTDFFGTSVEVMGSLWDGFVSGLGDAWKGIQKTFSVVMNFLSGLFKGVINGWITMFESFINFFIGGINGMLGGLNLVLDGIKAITGGAVSLHVSTIPKVSLPKLADGGIVPSTIGGRQVIVGEGGQSEAIIPLSKLSSMMQLPNNNVQAQPAQINVTVNAGMGADGANIAKTLISTLKQYERTNGAVWVSA